MMENDYNKQDLIEAYLSGDLNEADRHAFENKLNHDLLLKQEVAFQQDMVTALQLHRKMQLKSRLDAVEISTGHAGFSGMKWAAIGSGIILLLSTSLYFFYEPIFETKPSVIKTEVIAQKEALVETAPLETIKQEEASVIQPELATVEAPVAKETAKPVIEKKATKPAAVKTATEEFPDIPSDLPAQPGKPMDFNKTEQETPSGIIDNSAAATKKAVDVNVRKDENLNFHYQYYNSKIFLYGEFTDTPYELLEINDAEGRTLYMNYDSAFYLLQNNTMEPAPLKKIEDTLLINALKQKLVNK